MLPLTHTFIAANQSGCDKRIKTNLCFPLIAQSKWMKDTEKDLGPRDSVDFTLVYCLLYQTETQGWV